MGKLQQLWRLSGCCRKWQLNRVRAQALLITVMLAHLHSARCLLCIDTSIWRHCCDQTRHSCLHLESTFLWLKRTYSLTHSGWRFFGARIRTAHIVAVKVLQGYVLRLAWRQEERCQDGGRHISKPSIRTTCGEARHCEGRAEEGDARNFHRLIHGRQKFDICNLLLTNNIFKTLWLSTESK